MNSCGGQSRRVVGMGFGFENGEHLVAVVDAFLQIRHQDVVLLIPRIKKRADVAKTMELFAAQGDLLSRRKIHVMLLDGNLVCPNTKIECQLNRYHTQHEPKSLPRPS